MAQFRFETHLLLTNTNASGGFSVPHGLGGPGHEIDGITVAAQHLNGNWHTLEFSSAVDNRFWFNTNAVEGVMNSPNFFNRPVRIIVFARQLVPLDDNN